MNENGFFIGCKNLEKQDCLKYYREKYTLNSTSMPRN